MATGEDVFDKWRESAKGRPMTLVTAGQAGAGKSTLVTNLLRLMEGDAEAPVGGHSAESGTKLVKYHNNCINGINISIIDTPGLAGASDDDQVQVLAQLSEKTKGKADMLLYCASISPSSKLGELDRSIVKLLTTAFTPRIWERAILVLTFADYVKERNQKNKTKNPTVQQVMRNYAETFEKILADHKILMTVMPVLRSEGIKPRPTKQIAAVPAGEIPDEEILPGMKWNMCVYEEVLKKCKFDAMPAILKVLEVSSGKLQGALIGAAAGAGAGGAIGFAAGGIGAILGAIGGAIGGALVTSTGYGIAHYRFENSDESKRAQIQEEIEKLCIKAKTTNTGTQDSKKQM